MHAPILETVLEVLVEPDPGLTLRALEALGEYATEYGEKEEIHFVEGEMSVDPKGKTSGRGRRVQVGYRFIDRKGGRIVRFQLDRFSFSKLAPYTEWEAVRDEAKRLWAEYGRVAAVRSVRRIGVRYVNRVDLPVELPGRHVELKDWLRIGPEVADASNQRLGAFAMQLSLIQTDLSDTLATMRQAVVAPARPDTISIVLDIDVHRTGTIGLADVWGGLDILHDRENFIFESSITDRLRELIR